MRLYSISICEMNRDALRVLLVAKAKRGRYDRRMFDYNDKRDNVNIYCKRAVVRGYSRWLVVTSTTDGVHAPGSYHNVVNGKGRAIDLGLHPRLIGTARGRARLVSYQRAEFDAWRQGKRPHLRELIGPDNNAIVLKGVHSPLSEGSPLENQHDNHVHEAFV